jgi:hypothetical protein
MTSRFHRLIVWTLLPACLAALSAAPAPAQPAPPVQPAAKADRENLFSHSCLARPAPPRYDRGADARCT